jgi:hypothetical protein
MKKIKSLILVGLIFSLTSFSFSLSKAEGVYTVFAKQSGLGAGVNFPLIPLIDTTLYFHSLGETSVDGTATYTNGSSTYSLSGQTKVNSSAIEFQAKFPLSIMGVSIGGTLLLDIMNAKVSGTNQEFVLPGSLYAGVFGQYNQGLLPFVSVFGQAGLLVKVLDGEAEINKNLSGGSLNLSNINRSGLYFRAGVSVGI